MFADILIAIVCTLFLGVFFIGIPYFIISGIVRDIHGRV